MRRGPAPLAATLSSLAALALVSCGSTETTSPGASPDPADSPPPAETSEQPNQGEDDAEGAGDAESPTPDDAPDDAADSAADSAAESEEADGPRDPAETETRRAPGSGLPPGGAPRMAEEDLDAELHGEEGELPFYTVEGAEVGVAGLDPDEGSFAVYAEPTHSSEVTGELQSLDAVNLGGRERHHREPVPEEQPEEQPEEPGTSAEEDIGTWTEIELADGYGWIHGSAQDANIYWFGGTSEVTEEFEEVLAAQNPRELAESVGTRVSERGEEPGLEDPDFGPSWMLLSEPEDFDEDFYRVEVTGFMGDSAAGHRLFVHVEEAEGGYELAQVQRTLICYRGVAEDGLCT